MKSKKYCERLSSKSALISVGKDTYTPEHDLKECQHIRPALLRLAMHQHAPIALDRRTLFMRETRPPTWVRTETEGDAAC